MERGDFPDLIGPSDPAETPVPPDDARAAVTLFVCTTCRAADAGTEPPFDGARLLDAAAACALPPGVAVKGVACLANCARALSVAMVRRDGWTYVFGGLSAASAHDLLEGARLLAETDHGLMPWRGRPDCLKRGMIARIPPLSLPEENR